MILENTLFPRLLLTIKDELVHKFLIDAQEKRPNLLLETILKDDGYTMFEVNYNLSWKNGS